MMLLFPGVKGLCWSMTQREWVVSRQLPYGIIPQARKSFLMLA
jgi:hypothetical protein